MTGNQRRALVCPEFNTVAMRTLFALPHFGLNPQMADWGLVKPQGDPGLPPPTANTGSTSGVDFLKVQCAGFSGI